MWTIFKILTLVLVGTFPLLMHPGSVRAAEAIVDQEQAETDGTWALIEDYSYPSQRGQIFTAGMDGYLTRISVYLENDPTNPATTSIMVSIQTMAGGLPSGNTAASGMIYPENIPTSEGWVNVDLGGMFVAEGTQYAIILSLGTGRDMATGGVKWFGDFLQDLYAGGRSMSNYEDGQGWRLGNGDLVFKTYVLPYVLDQAQTAPSTFPWRIGDAYDKIAQIVTAGTYGIFYKVSLYLDNGYSFFANGPVSVSIQTVIDGEPSGNEIGHGEIPADAVPSYDNPDWIDVFIGNVLVHPGNQYAVVVSSGGGTIRWYSSGDVYTRGIMLLNDGRGWLNWSVADAMFKTYVKPDVLDQRQDQNGGSISFHGGEKVAQTFKPTMSGFLDRMQLWLSNDYNCSAVDVTIQIVNPLGYPSGIVIGSRTIPSSSLFSSPGYWTTIHFNNTYVIAGLQYAIVLEHAWGSLSWPSDNDRQQIEGQMKYNDGNGWMVYRDSSNYAQDAMIIIYVAEPLASSIVTSPPPSPPAPFTPCSDGVCPAVTATVTPNDSTARITSNVQFRERQNGTVHGILNFNDSRTGEIALRGCTTDSAACRLTVTTLRCTDQNTITVNGTYTPKGENESYYELNLSGDKNEIGTFTLTLSLPDGDQTYTLTRKGIVDVTCPPINEGP